MYHGQTTSKWTAGVTIPATPDGAGKVVLDVGTTDVASLRAGHSQSAAAVRHPPRLTAPMRLIRWMQVPET